MCLVACLGRGRHLVGAPCKCGAHAALVILCGVCELELRIGRDDCNLPQIPARKPTLPLSTSLCHPSLIEMPVDLSTTLRKASCSQTWTRQNATMLTRTHSTPREARERLRRLPLQGHWLPEGLT